MGCRFRLNIIFFKHLMSVAFIPYCGFSKFEIYRDLFDLFHYRPQQYLQKGYVFTGVCLSTGGVYTPWQADTPQQADTPAPGRQTLPWQANHPNGQTPPRRETPSSCTDTRLGRHPPPWADTPFLDRHPLPGQTPPSLGRHPPPWADSPPIWLLQQMVRILLKCILV